MKLENLPFYVVILIFARQVSGIECSADKTLKNYNWQKAIHLEEMEMNAPPSTHFMEWYVNICGSDRDGMPSECQDDDMLCGLEWVKLPDKDPILTKAIHVGSDKYDQASSNTRQVVISFNDSPWGQKTIEPKVTFNCDSSRENDIVRPVFIDERNEHIKINVEIFGPSGCTKSHSKPVSSKGGSSWFMWFLIYVVLFALVYFVVVSYMNRRGNTFQDFLSEFFERTQSAIVGLTSLLKEILGRVFNRGSVDRAEYSAI